MYKREEYDYFGAVRRDAEKYIEQNNVDIGCCLSDSTGETTRESTDWEQSRWK